MFTFKVRAINTSFNIPVSISSSGFIFSSSPMSISISSSGLPPMPRSRPSARPLSSSYSNALIKSSQVNFDPRLNCSIIELKQIQFFACWQHFLKKKTYSFAFSAIEGALSNSTTTSTNLGVSSNYLRFEWVVN